MKIVTALDVDLIPNIIALSITHFVCAPLRPYDSQVKRISLIVPSLY